MMNPGRRGWLTCAAVLSAGFLVGAPATSHAQGFGGLGTTSGVGMSTSGFSSMPNPYNGGMFYQGFGGGFNQGFSGNLNTDLANSYNQLMMLAQMAQVDPNFQTDFANALQNYQSLLQQAEMQLLQQMEQRRRWHHHHRGGFGGGLAGVGDAMQSQFSSSSASTTDLTQVGAQVGTANDGQWQHHHHHWHADQEWRGHPGSVGRQHLHRHHHGERRHG